MTTSTTPDLHDLTLAPGVAFGVPHRADRSRVPVEARHRFDYIASLDDVELRDFHGNVDTWVGINRGQSVFVTSAEAVEVPTGMVGVVRPSARLLGMGIQVHAPLLPPGHQGPVGLVLFNGFAQDVRIDFTEVVAQVALVRTASWV